MINHITVYFCPCITWTRGRKQPIIESVHAFTRRAALVMSVFSKRSMFAAVALNNDTVIAVRRLNGKMFTVDFRNGLIDIINETT